MNIDTLARGGAKGIAWHAIELITGRQLQHLAKLRQWQWIQPEALRRLQADRLTALIRHAARRVPYYADCLTRSGVIDARGDVALENFGRLPLLDKPRIRDQRSQLQDKESRRWGWYENTSGGSTGEPLLLIQDRNYLTWSKAMTVLTDEWSGRGMGEPKVYVWGSLRDICQERERLKVAVMRWIRNETYINSFRMSPERMAEAVRTMNRIRPAQIHAYVESIYELAKFVEAEKLTVHAPRAVIATAGTLYEPMRELIARAFRAPVFNVYGSREVSGIACECEAHAGLHICAPNCLIEILRPDGTAADPGEAGEVVVTALTNYAMPLLRYRIGDMASFATGACPCGRSWPRLATVHGRVSDNFVSRSGALVHGQFFTLLMYFRRWARKFQVIQEDYDHVHYLIVRDPSFAIAPNELDEMRQKIRMAMGETCQTTFDFVDDIPATASGKFRYLISRVNTEQSSAAVARGGGHAA